MTFSVDISSSILSLVSQFFQGKPNGFGQVFNYLTFKHMTALRKGFSLSLIISINYCFGYMQS